MLSCTLSEFNHIGLFGFEEEPKLLMRYPLHSQCCTGKGFFYAIKKINKTDHFPY